MASISFSISVAIARTSATSYTTSAYLKKIDTDASYTMSAVLVLTPQCETPSAAVLPTIKEINLYCGPANTNTPQVALLPTIVSINIYTKSC